MTQQNDVLTGTQWLFQYAPNPICLLDDGLRVIWANHSFYREYGDLSGRPVGETAEIREDTTTSPQLLPILDEFNIVVAYIAFFSATVGMNTEPMTETMTIATAQKYQIVAENTSDTIVLADKDGLVHYVSPSFQSLVGHSVEEYDGRDAFKFVHPDDRDRLRDSHHDVIRTKQSVELEYRLTHKLGHAVYVEARVKPVVNRDGEIQHVVAVVRDVSQRKQTEQLLQNILDNVNAVVVSTDKDFSRMTFCSDNVENYGISKQEYMKNPIIFHDLIHPDDNEILFNEAKDKLDAGIPVQKEVRLINGPELKWLRFILHPYVDSGGLERRIDGIWLDITEKKKSELALEESEQRYKSLFENNLDGVFSIDLEGVVVNVNASFEHIVGYKLNELMYCSILHLVLEEDRPLVRQGVAKVMDVSEPIDIECRILNRKRDERILTVTLVPIFLSGQLNGIHGIVKDITTRRREEEELIRSEGTHRALQQSINRFSSDLANVMKVSDLEARLIDEVSTVLSVSNVFVEEAESEATYPKLDGNDVRIKIGQKKRTVYLRFTKEERMTSLEHQWLETVVHYATILYDNLQFIEDLMKQIEETVENNETPKWLLRLFFKLSEKERFALSSDLHDSVLQDLIIWYRRLESLRSGNDFGTFINKSLKEIEGGILDAIHQIRITCNELRPPFLLKMGLIESLKSLLSYTRMFANYEIAFYSDDFNSRLNEEQVIGLYRIVQELLNNASKHSQASKVTMVLSSDENCTRFSYKDDGVGFDVMSHEGSFKNMGISGIEKRVISLEGSIDMKSSPNCGFQVAIAIPTYLN